MDDLYRNLQHDPSVLLSSHASYDVIYHGSVRCRNSGDFEEAKRAYKDENFGKSHTGRINVNCRQIIIKREHVELYSAKLYDISYSVAFSNNLMFVVKEPKESLKNSIKNSDLTLFLEKIRKLPFKIFHSKTGQKIQMASSGVEARGSDQQDFWSGKVLPEAILLFTLA